MEIVNDQEHEVQEQGRNEGNGPNQFMRNRSKDCIVRKEVPFRFNEGRSDEGHGVDEVVGMHEELGSNRKGKQPSDGENA